MKAKAINKAFGVDKYLRAARLRIKRKWAGRVRTWPHYARLGRGKPRNSRAEWAILMDAAADYKTDATESGGGGANLEYAKDYILYAKEERMKAEVFYLP